MRLRAHFFLGYTPVTVNGDSFIGSIRELKVGEYKRSASATCRDPSCPLDCFIQSTQLFDFYH